MTGLMATPQWQALVAERHAIEAQSISELFAADPQRFDDFSILLGGLLLDYSKQPVTAALREKLCALAKARGLELTRDAMMSGEPVNASEGRAALHTALRVPDGDDGWAGHAVAREVQKTRSRMRDLANAIRSGELTGATGKPITHVINIGIGGSDLGPRLAMEALAAFADGPEVHFIANVDGVELERAMAACDPESTLVVAVSKSFGTQETLANTHALMAWLRRRVPHDEVIAHQVVAVTSNVERARQLGIDPARVLPMWDWVGGRYSLWSAVGFSVLLGIGPAAFDALLAGAHAMDRHFADAPLDRNMPVMMALCSVLNGTLLDRRSHAIAPYTERLGRLPAYLQQLVMESNGKSVSLDGQPITHPTASLIWGQTGTPGQHAFFQALHQGFDVVPVDFIGVARPVAGEQGEPLELTANLFAQSQALMLGRTDPRLPSARFCPGNRPSNTLLLESLDPWHFGALVALYEHRTFTESVIWGVNAFDQFGVELGKGLADELKPVIAGGRAPDGLDGSTAGLIARYRAWRAR